MKTTDGRVAQRKVESALAAAAGSNPAGPDSSSCRLHCLPDRDVVDACGVLIVRKLLAWAKGKDGARLVTRVDRHGRTWLEMAT